MQYQDGPMGAKKSNKTERLKFFALVNATFCQIHTEVTD